MTAVPRPTRKTAAKKPPPAPKVTAPEHHLAHLSPKVQDGALFDGLGVLRLPAVLGIDQSYSGFAVTALADNGTYFSWCYKAPLTGVRRLRKIEEFLYAVLEIVNAHYNITTTVLEGYAFGSQMANMAGELGATIKLQLAEYFPDADGPAYPYIVSPTSLKMFATGKGTSQKQHVLLACYKKWNAEFRDDNMADSFVLAQMGRALDTEPELLQYEAKALEKLSREYGDVE